MDIVDNAPEMALDDPKFADMLSKITPKGEAKAPVPKTEPVKSESTTDGKSDTTEASSASAKTDPDEKPAESDEGTDNDESPDKLKARIRGLQAELTRRKGNADKVSELELQLAKVQGQLEQINKAPKGTTAENELETAIKALDDKALISKQTDWDDELADARARYASAEERGDEQALAKQAQRITYAKKVISAIRTESKERTERKQTEDEQSKAHGAKIKTEFDEMYNTMNTEFPDFQDKESELWKAGNKEYLSNPAMMRVLGPAGEIVAAALAILKNPHLITQRSETSVRRDVVGKLEQGVKKALSVGAAAPKTGRTTVPAVDTGEGLAEFNRLVDKIKGG